MIPANPKKERETIEAEIKVMGRPSNDFKGFALATLERTPQKRTIARKKPRPQPSDVNILSTKFRPSLMLLTVIPRTAQFVVISGR